MQEVIQFNHIKFVGKYWRNLSENNHFNHHSVDKKNPYESRRIHKNYFTDQRTFNIKTEKKKNYC